MEDIVLTIRIDTEYREKAAVLGVDFEDYLTGIVIAYLCQPGGMSRLVAQASAGSTAARMSAHNAARLGEAMRAMIEDTNSND